jgi:hypothetical protein
MFGIDVVGEWFSMAQNSLFLVVAAMAGMRDA